jgi:hypothetical protein
MYRPHIILRLFYNEPEEVVYVYGVFNKLINDRSDLCIP